METLIQFLSIEDFRVLKIIKIQGPEWNNFTGYIYYKRLLSKKYQSSTPDYIDDLIINSIKELYPGSTLVVNKDILFKGELEDILKGYTGGTSIDFTIRFTPQIPYEKVFSLVGRKFHEYIPKFKLNLFLNEGNEKIHHISDFGIAYIPFEQIDDFNNRIKTIDFTY